MSVTFHKVKYLVYILEGDTELTDPIPAISARISSVIGQPPTAQVSLPFKDVVSALSNRAEDDAEASHFEYSNNLDMYFTSTRKRLIITTEAGDVVFAGRMYPGQVSIGARGLEYSITAEHPLGQLNEMSMADMLSLSGIGDTSEAYSLRPPKNNPKGHSGTIQKRMYDTFHATQEKYVTVAVLQDIPTEVLQIGQLILDFCGEFIGRLEEVLSVDLSSKKHWQGAWTVQLLAGRMRETISRIDASSALMIMRKQGVPGHSWEYIINHLISYVASPELHTKTVYSFLDALCRDFGLIIAPGTAPVRYSHRLKDDAIAPEDYFAEIIPYTPLRAFPDVEVKASDVLAWTQTPLIPSNICGAVRAVGAPIQETIGGALTNARPTLVSSAYAPTTPTAVWNEKGKVISTPVGRVHQVTAPSWLFPRSYPYTGMDSDNKNNYETGQAWRVGSWLKHQWCERSIAKVVSSLQLPISYIDKIRPGDCLEVSLYKPGDVDVPDTTVGSEAFTAMVFVRAVTAVIDPTASTAAISVSCTHSRMVGDGVFYQMLGLYSTELSYDPDKLSFAEIKAQGNIIAAKVDAPATTDAGTVSELEHNAATSTDSLVTPEVEE